MVLGPATQELESPCLLLKEEDGLRQLRHGEHGPLKWPSTRQADGAIPERSAERAQFL